MKNRKGQFGKEWKGWLSKRWVQPFRCLQCLMGQLVVEQIRVRQWAGSERGLIAKVSAFPSITWWITTES